ncbi:MAG: peptidylprolyl isomerase [Acidobacteriota bacterium]
MTRAPRPGCRGLLALLAVTIFVQGSARVAGQAKPVASPVIVVETSRGTFQFETYPVEAPKTVAHIAALVRAGFYDGQRFHRAIPGFLVQWGDPRSRDPKQEGDWGLGPAASSGKPIGTAETSKKRTHTAGAVAVAHLGNPAGGDSQLYVTLADRPDLNGYYTVFGHVTAGADVPAQLQRGDVVVRMYVKD